MSHGSQTEVDHDLLRRIRHLEHCCDKLVQTIKKLGNVEEDLHNRCRSLERKVHKLEVALLGEKIGHH